MSFTRLKVALRLLMWYCYSDVPTSLDFVTYYDVRVILGLHLCRYLDIFSCTVDQFDALSDSSPQAL